MPVVYVARRRLRVGGRDVMPGDEVPEASSWRHLPVYVHNGSLALVQTDVHYARGNLQRRPDTGRDDYRKLGMERWYGEIRYGEAAPPAPDAPVIDSVTPTILTVGDTGSPFTNVVRIDGSGLVNCYMILSAPTSGGGSIVISYGDTTTGDDTYLETEIILENFLPGSGMQPTYPCPGDVYANQGFAPYQQSDPFAVQVDV